MAGAEQRLAGGTQASSCCVPPANQTARAPRRAHAAGVNWSSAASGRNASPSEKHQKHVVQTCGRLEASFYDDAGLRVCGNIEHIVATVRGAINRQYIVNSCRDVSSLRYS